MELSIVMPTYNEEKRLPPTLERVLNFLKNNYAGAYEILIVDDGSSDKTAEVVLEYKNRYPRIELLKLPENKGYGGAVREGMLAARGDFVLTMDADGSAGEEAILRFLNFMKEHPDVGMAVGSRTVSGARILTPQPILRVFLGNVFLLVAKILFGWEMQDRINGFKMFRREAAQDTFSRQYYNSVLGAVEIVYVVERRGWKYELLPIFWTDYKGSKIKPFRDSLKTVLGMLNILWMDWRGAYKN